MIEYLFIFLLVLAALLSIFYFFLIAFYCYGWTQTNSLSVNVQVKTFVSVIIVARNEEENILNCLNAIANQSFPEQLIEIIVVDDDSEDDTNKIVKEFSTCYKNLKLISLKNKKVNSGKKAGISSAIKIAKGKLIVTTDADCVMGEKWLLTIVSNYEQTQAKMIVSPICFYNEKTILEKMQSLELNALITSSGASLYFNSAIMCNGANLAYTKEVFDDINGYEGIDKLATGDDVLLMYKVNRKYPKSIYFIKNQDAIVYTKPKRTVKQFVNQRIRWASKGFFSLNSDTKVVSLLVFMMNSLMLILPFALFVHFEQPFLNNHFLEIYFILFAIKCLIDFLLLFLGASFFNNKKYLIYFLPEQILYSFYVVLISVLGIFKKYEWKDMKSNN